MSNIDGDCPVEKLLDKSSEKYKQMVIEPNADITVKKSVEVVPTPPQR